MIESISHKIVKARKEYTCELWEHIKELTEGQYDKFTFSELKVLAKYKEAKGKIATGELHVCQVNKYEGLIYNWRANEDVFKMLNDKNLLPDDY